MRKLIISSILLFFTVTVFGQQLKPVKIDNVVTVSLPANYDKKDTLNQQVYSANGSFGYMVVVKATDDHNQPLKRENDLNKVMETYVTNLQGQYNNASAQNVRDTTVGALKAKAFTLKYSAEDNSTQFKNFVLLYTTAASYFFEYAYSGIRQEVVNGELKAFLSSIKLAPGLQRTDQYLSNAHGMSPVVQIVVFGGGALLIIGLVVVVINRKKNMRLG